MLYSSVFSVELYKLVVSLSLNGLKDLFLLNLDWKELKKNQQQMKTFLLHLPSPWSNEHFLSCFSNAAIEKTETSGCPDV